MHNAFTCLSRSQPQTFITHSFQTLEFGMKPILCIGETKDEFDLDITKEVCAMQVSKDLAGVSKEDMANVVIACKCFVVFYIDLGRRFPVA